MAYQDEVLKVFVSFDEDMPEEDLEAEVAGEEEDLDDEEETEEEEEF